MDHENHVKVENNAYRVLVATLRSWGLPVPVEAVKPRQISVDNVFDRISSIPTIKEIEKSVSIYASFCGLNCRLGVRQVQITSDQLGRALYWRRYGPTELSHQVILSGLVINSSLSRKDPDFKLCERSRLLIAQFNELAKALLNIDSTTQGKHYQALTSSMAEQFREICNELLNLIQISAQQGVKYSPHAITNLLSMHQKSLEALLSSYRDVRTHLLPLNDAYNQLASDAWQSDLLAQLVWFESAKTGGSNTIAQLSENLAQFARRGVDTAHEFQGTTVTDYGDELIYHAISLLTSLNRSIVELYEH